MLLRVNRVQVSRIGAVQRSTSPARGRVNRGGHLGTDIMHHAITDLAQQALLYLLVPSTTRFQTRRSLKTSPT